MIEDIVTISWYITCFLCGMVIGMVLGMIRMWFYLKNKRVKRRIDCMTCNHFDRWSDSCPFCQYEYDENTDCEQRSLAGVIEK